jgi:type III pantothenate kinase
MPYGKRIKMFIAVDIGNTHTVIGIYKKEKIVADYRLTSTLQWTENKIVAQVHSLLNEVGTNKKKINGIGISSVVPHLTKVYAAIAKKYFRQEPMIVSTELNLGINIHYDNPKSLGADRICDAVAGYAKYGGPLIIIDFGTATTYDIIASNGDFLGGVIAPGIETSAISLHKRTANLPRLVGANLHLPKTTIGINTINSMQTGVLWGAIDAMTGMVNRIQKEFQKHQSKKAVVIATGGFASFVGEHTRIIQHIEPTLVLDGIRLIYDRVKNKMER